MIALAEATGRAWPPIDAQGYWNASVRLGDLYPATWSAFGYNYAGPPPIAQLFSLVHWLPFEVVLVPWLLLNFAALWYATRVFALPIIGLGLLAIGLGLPFVGAPLGIILLGNAGMLMTAGVVASVRSPGAAAVPFAAKIGPSVALLWHLRNPRAFLYGLLAILALLALSVAFTPTAWPEWLAFGLANFGRSPVGEIAVPFAIRAPLGVALVLLAARFRLPWLVAIGAGLAILADYGSSFATVWVGSLGLWWLTRQGEGPEDA